MKPRSYNPLDYASLSESLAREVGGPGIGLIADPSDGFSPIGSPIKPHLVVK